MFKNYLIIAIRTILADKLFSFINIAGLAVGLASCLLIFLFVESESGYDGWLPNAENIYRVEGSFSAPGRDLFIGATIMPAIRDPIAADFPGILRSARLYPETASVRIDENIYEESMGWVDSNFLDIFQFHFIEGEAATAFSDKMAMVLTQRTAKKFFGERQAVGELVIMENGNSYTVSGVIADLPQATHFRFDVLARIDSVEGAENFLALWLSYVVFNYVELAPGTDFQTVNQALPAFIDRHVPVQTMPGFQEAKPSDVVGLWLRPIGDIHLYSKGVRDMKPGGNINTVRTFGAVAVLILLIASLNFMNLSTSKSTRRAREVTMRKVLGASRGRLVVQFLTESIVLTLISLFLALMVVELALPWFNGFLGKEITADFMSQPSQLLALFVMATLVGIMNGAYPALYLSGVRPVKFLSANQAGDSSNSLLRSSLVLSQFAISIGLIVATSVVYKQTVFANDYDLGFEQENLLVVRGLGALEDRSASDAFMDQVLRLPGAVAAGRSSAVPGDPIGFNTTISLPEGDPNEPIWLAVTQADGGFFEALGLVPVQGRAFSGAFPRDIIPVIENNAPFDPDLIVSVMLNESAVRRLGYADSAAAIGKNFRMGIGGGIEVAATVVGVMPDIHFLHLQNAVRPMIFYQFDTPFQNMTVRAEPESARAVADRIAAIWKERVPNTSPKIEYIDQLLGAGYNDVRQQASLFSLFALLAVLIASLGLFGLSAFTAQRRTKEIGIRKVLGARIADIVRLLVWQFSKPVLLANLLAWPVAWYFMQDWLEGFAYRIELSPFYFLTAGGLALVIAWATVAGHAARAARANPIHALRRE